MTTVPFNNLQNSRTNEDELVKKSTIRNKNADSDSGPKKYRIHTVPDSEYKYDLIFSERFKKKQESLSIFILIKLSKLVGESSQP